MLQKKLPKILTKTIPSAEAVVKQIDGSIQPSPDKVIAIAKRFEEITGNLKDAPEFVTIAAGKVGKNYAESSKKVRKFVDEIKMKTEMGQLDATEKRLVDLKRECARLDITASEIDGHISKGNYGALIRKAGNQAEIKSYQQLADGYKDVVTGLIGDPKAINRVYLDESLTPREKAVKMAELVYAAQDVNKQGFELGKEGLGSFVDKGLTGIGSKMAEGINYFNRTGNPYAANILGKLAGIERNATPLSGKQLNLMNQMMKIDEALGKKAEAIKFYIDNRDLSKRVDYAEMVGQKMIKANPELKETIKQQFGVDLNYKDFEYANKKASALRELGYTKDMWDRGMFDDATSTLSKSFDKYDGVDIKHLDKTFKGDLGGNYHPRRPTKEYLEGLLEKHPEMKQEYIGIDKNDFASQSKFFEKARSIDSDKRVGLAENRLSAAEEVNAYVLGLKDSMIRTTGTDLLNQAKIATLMPFGEIRARNLKDEHRALKEISDHWNANFNAKGYGDASGGEQALMGLVRAQIPLALTNTLMLLSNSMQAFMTSSFRHGYFNVAKEHVKWLTPFAKEVLLHPTKTKEIIRRIAEGWLAKPLIKGEDAVLAKHLARFADNMFFLHSMMDEQLTEIFKGMGGKKVGATLSLISEIITTPFQLSDIFSRAVAFSSAHNHGVASLKKFHKNLTTMDFDTAKVQLFKDLHLGTYMKHGDDASYILKALDMNNLKGSSEEMLYRYATQSVRQSIFDYGSMGQSYLKAKAKEVSPLGGAALTFTSWPMFFHELFKGATNAYQMGDKAPLTKMILGGMAVFGATTLAMRDDDPVFSSLANHARKEWGSLGKLAARDIEQFPAYLRTRSPGMSYFAIPELAVRRPAGILTAPIGAMLYGGYKVLNKSSEFLEANQDRDSLKFAELTAKEYMKSDIFRRKVYNWNKQLYEADLIEKDIHDKIRDTLNFKIGE
jgi:hypothetical protein